MLSKDVFKVSLDVRSLKLVLTGILPKASAFSPKLFLTKITGHLFRNEVLIRLRGKGVQGRVEFRFALTKKFLVLRI